MILLGTVVKVERHFDIWLKFRRLERVVDVSNKDVFQVRKYVGVFLQIWLTLLVIVVNGCGSESL
jgi:hypothetical protein